MESNSVRSGRQDLLRGVWLHRRPAAVRRVATSALILGMAVSTAVAWEGSADKTGLHGIIKNEIPTGLGTEAFNELSGNWSEWGKGVSALVTKLYTDDKLDAKAQLDLLKQLQHKIEVIDRAVTDPRFAALYDPLMSIRGRLARRVDLDLAILKTFELKPEEVKAAKVKAAKAEALDALSDLEADLNKVPNGAAWLPFIHESQLRQALTANGSADAIGETQARLDSGSSLKDPGQREFLAKPAFRKLSAALGKVHEAEQANPASVDEKAETEKFAALVAAIEGFEDNGGSADAKKVIESLEAAEKATIDGGSLIGHAVREHYMNYNLQIVASQALLNKLVSDQQTTNGPVNDFVLGANVNGNEQTTTDVSVELEPGKDVANLELVLNGVTQSSTVGSTSQANIYTQGYHRWGAKKPLRFDGKTLTTGPATMTYVQPSNTTTGASTQYSGGLFGSYAEGQAMQAANSQRGESEAIASQRIQTKVLPEMDARVEKLIEQTNEKLNSDLRKRLGGAGVLPSNVIARSNDAYLRLSAEVGGPGDLSGDTGNPAIETGAGLVISIHESLLNNAVGQMKFAGQTMTDAQVTAELERFLSQVAGRKVDFTEAAKKMAAAQAAALAQAQAAALAQAQAAGMPPGAAANLPGGVPPAAKKPEQSPEQKNSQFVFDQNDPIRFTIDDGEIKLVIRAGFKQQGQPDVPTQEITVSLRLAAMAGRMAILRGNVSVAGGGQVLRSGAIKQKIEAAIPEMTPLDPQIHIPREGRPEVDLTVARISADNGWLTMWAN
jgi:hypothetical protein